MAPHAAAVFAEVSACCFGELSYGDIGEQARLRVYTGAPDHVEPTPVPEPKEAPADGGLHLVAYKPLFSGPAVERVPELQFQRPQPVVEISRADAETRGIANGQRVRVSSNGTSVEFLARVNKKLRRGVALVALEHAGGLQGTVEVR